MKKSKWERGKAVREKQLSRPEFFGRWGGVRAPGRENEKERVERGG